MNESIFGMYFVNTSLAEIKDVLLEVASKDDIRERVPLSGAEELTVENAVFELYVHYSGRSKKGGENYLGSGEYFGPMDELQQFVERLAGLFTSKGIVYEFEFYEETKDGQQIGDSQTLRHPDFG